MTLKSGVYALYKGKEYSATIDGFTKNIVLFSEDQSSVAVGFVPRHDRYEKEVAPAEVESLCDYTPYAMVGEARVEVLSIKENGIELIYNGTQYASALRKLGFEQIDRYSYLKFFPESDLPEILMEVIPMPGYKLPEEPA